MLWILADVIPGVALCSFFVLLLLTYTKYKMADQDQQQPLQDQQAVAAVSVKLPEFWKQNPAAWFSYAESMFNLRNIVVSRTKFDYVITSLPCELISDISDVLTAPDNQNPYEVLKEALIRRTSLSERDRLRQLLSKEDLGDRKPSQLLRHMQTLLGQTETNFDKKLLRELFTQRLPGSVQQVLASTPPDTPLDALAQIADRVMEVSAPVINAIRPPQQSPSKNTALEKQVSDLANAVAALTTEVKHLKGQRSRSQSRSDKQDSKLCFYHFKFGDKAKKCVSPCNYSGNDQSRC